jgi:hypothetical protein
MVVSQTDTMRRTLEDELRTRKRSLEAVGDDAAFVARWRETLAWLTRADRPGLDELLDGAEERVCREILAPLQRRYLTLQENAVAQRLFTLESRGNAALAQLLEMPFARQTYERVAEALELVDFGCCRVFVNIGCGPFPAAALLIHARTTVPRILAVDNDATAVGLASRVASRLASPRLEVAYGDGTRLDFSGADVIYVANHVVPKQRVLARIAETAPCGAMVLVREPYGLGLVLAERGCAALPPRLRIVSEGSGDANFHSMHVLCEVGSKSAPDDRSAPLRERTSPGD